MKYTVPDVTFPKSVLTQQKLNRIYRKYKRKPYQKKTHGGLFILKQIGSPILDADGTVRLQIQPEMDGKSFEKLISFLKKRNSLRKRGHCLLMMSEGLTYLTKIKQSFQI